MKEATAWQRAYRAKKARAGLCGWGGCTAVPHVKADGTLGIFCEGHRQRMGVTRRRRWKDIVDRRRRSTGGELRVWLPGEAWLVLEAAAQESGKSPSELASEVFTDAALRTLLEAGPP